MKFTLLLLIAGAIFGQDFDVATVKISSTMSIQSKITTNSNSFSATNSSLGEAIAFAYNLKPYQVIGPDWISSQDTLVRFDIQAKNDDLLSIEQLRHNLQNLLSERFGLKFHYEERLLDGLNITVGRKFLLEPIAEGDNADTKLASKKSPGGNFYMMQLRHMSIDQLANDLSKAFKMIVINSTGLPGKYNGQIEFHLPVDVPNFCTTFLIDTGLLLTQEKIRTKVLIADAAQKVPISN